jgi:hypothetical protein
MHGEAVKINQCGVSAKLPGWAVVSNVRLKV